MKKHILSAVATLAFGILYFYFAIPAINVRAAGFWVMLILMAAVYISVCVLVAGDKEKVAEGVRGLIGHKKSLLTSKIKRLLIIAAVVALVVAGASFFSSSVVFRAQDYQSMLTVGTRDFNDDFEELPLSQIPVVDRDTAQRLGDRELGTVGDLVSQFNVSSYYSQINYKNAPYRVSPLEYNGILKWFANRQEGIRHYVSIDMATQKTQLIKLDEGMKYSPSEYFSRDLYRHIRMHYPTKMFENLSFEIDDNGHPYWIMSYYEYTFGLFGGKDIAGIILVDAVSGEMTDLSVKEVPQWIDLVYSPQMILEQADNWGSLKSGFWNSVFAQKNVVVTTDGYNYLALEDDVWLYTGITSVAADESNIGFVLVNMRTKEARTYNINGAEEYSAMESAQGKIQEKGYNATFPLLINVEGIPSYFISLKDNAGLVKAYAFVSVSEYQLVGVGDTVAEAQAAYLRVLGQSDLTTPPPTEAIDPHEGVIVAIASAVIDGNTVYYIQVQENGSETKIYTADISVDERLPFLTAGDQIFFHAREKEILDLTTERTPEFSGEENHD